MKTYFSKTKTFALALVTLFATSFTAPAFAAEEDDKKAEISYVGNVNDLPVYRLSLNNKANEIYFVSVTDNDGNVIYNEKVSGAKIVRNYQFDADLYSEYDLTFTISNLKGKTVSVYNVSKSKKVINEVAVNKVK
jgi:ABC-type nitrate/sulfonate/bicarbonate transport system substrate-binding protein